MNNSIKPVTVFQGESKTGKQYQIVICPDTQIVSVIKENMVEHTSIVSIELGVVDHCSACGYCEIQYKYIEGSRDPIDVTQFVKPYLRLTCMRCGYDWTNTNCLLKENNNDRTYQQLG